MAYVPLADQDQEMEMHHPHSWVEKYVWSQDHKVIAIQYGGLAVLTGIVGLVLSLLFRLQLGFPESVDFVDPNFYYQAVTMHGMIMVVYFLTALFLGGFGNYMVPLMLGARDMVFPFLNMMSVWTFLISVIILMASFFVGGGPTGAGWTLYPPQTTMAGTPGHDAGIILMLVSLAVFVVAFTMGGLNYVVTNLTVSLSRHDPDADAPHYMGNICRNGSGFVCIPGTTGCLHHDDVRYLAGYKFLYASRYRVRKPS
jgi:cytochrome c oxidase subunit 1